MMDSEPPLDARPPQDAQKVAKNYPHNMVDSVLGSPSPNDIGPVSVETADHVQDTASDDEQQGLALNLAAIEVLYTSYAASFPTPPKIGKSL